MKLKCTECNHQNRSCVDMFWDHMKRLTQKTKEEISVKKGRHNELLDQLFII